ncbi:MAG TPA: hypothetical protein PLP25_04960, partial [Candidatus Limiplasma sp.]|nr:hypothetical protein [Candidatus Limiplasma sp.]
LLYYNKDGGKYYHDIANCGMVKEQYLPLSSFTYAELDTAPFSELEPCPGCAPAKRKSVIDELNAARGLQTSLPEVTQSPAPDATNAAEMLSEGQTVAPSSLDSVNDPEVEINIFPAK